MIAQGPIAGAPLGSSSTEATGFGNGGFGEGPFGDATADFIHPPLGSGVLGGGTGAESTTGGGGGAPDVFNATATGTYGFDGTATSATGQSATATGTYGFDGTAGAAQEYFGTGTGTYGFDGTAAASAEQFSTATGAYSLDGTATGTADLLYLYEILQSIGAVDGDVGRPAYSFINDPSSGIINIGDKLGVVVRTQLVLTIDADGNMELVGDGNGLVMSSDNGTRYLVTVDNAGALQTTAV